MRSRNRHLWSLFLGLGLFTTVSTQASVTINLAAGQLKTSLGAAMPTSGIVVLVASTNGTTFGGPTATAFVSGGNIEVGRWNLSASGTAGEFQDTTGPKDLINGLSAGQALALYWFPTVTNLVGGAPGAGTKYGFYRDPVANGTFSSGVDGSDPWYVPADGAQAVTLYMLTSEYGGSVSSGSASASLTVPGSNLNPVANTDSYTRTSNLSLKINISDLITNDTDADGGTITLTGINLTTTNNVTLTTNATDILYPSNAANVNDKFTYTISDGQGGTATGSVLINLITVTGTNSVLTLQTGVPATGTNTLRFAGVPGFTYTSQVATNVNGPWVNYATNTAAASGLWTNLDRSATNAQRFYRAAY